jgi:hypothetical protein
MSFVFKHFLASFSQFSCNYLFFQLLLSFVPALAIWLHLFSITYWLRSYLSLYVLNREFSQVPGPSRLFSRLRTPGRLPTTICPHNDHSYRLSLGPRFVKRKIDSVSVRSNGGFTPPLGEVNSPLRIQTETLLIDGLL